MSMTYLASLFNKALLLIVPCYLKYGSVAAVLPQNLLELQNQNLHFNKLPGDLFAQ